jgi:hypothetical protein
MKKSKQSEQISELVDDRVTEDYSHKSEKDPLSAKVPEVGGVKGPEPTRYGDWEKNGRCIDF